MTIKRHEGLAVFSSVVEHAGLVYVSGLVPKDRTLDVGGQAKDIFNQIDANLAKAGIDKTRLLKAEIWLKQIERDFAAMNAAWLDWVDPDHLPVRVTSEANLASPDILIEIMVTAAK
ncbi:enamine deaminase RidA (YjgF/YER057c/UK114 family) [Paenalcaligenes hominis]|uniref:Enamine deaminase RidA (YjgF/YER057c/UK114 family) n=1 Tax=Paenalcaligenes hominis TaxID=643674 RepID=A0ABX0WU91_9BURK|nr:RidA family protein [Paenalcaligenes hominis]NJB66311.1 enamine deaminase RidA (YjgF/YER057c/UK114 family) [Paenalcaligenes hominis]GGE74877.1 hypothetical protein GCM10007278_23840 [Paenalcaligenes hominis]